MSTDSETDSPTTDSTADSSTDSTAGQTGPPAGEFFDRIRDLAVVRPDEGRWAAGVSAGLAYRWGVDPLLIRGGFVALSVFGGAGLALYGLCWLLLPQADGRIHAQQVLDGKVTAGFVGGVFAILVNLVTANAVPVRLGFLGWRPGGLLTLAVLGLGAWWFLNRRPVQTEAPVARRSPDTIAEHPRPGTSVALTPTRTSPTPSTTPGTGSAPGPGSVPGPAPAPVQVRSRDLHAPSHPLTLLTIGAALLASASVLVYYRSESALPGHAWLVATAVALGVLAVGLVLAGLLGRRGGGLVPLAILLVIVSIGGAAVRGSVGAIGERTWTPRTADQAAQGYDLGVGNAVLDLTTPGLTSAATASNPVRLSAQVGAGRLRVVVPAGVAVEVDANVGVGQIEDRVSGLQGGVQRGEGRDVVAHSGGTPPTLVVTAELGLGNIEITS